MEFDLQSLGCEGLENYFEIDERPPILGEPS
jgi:hypothetical protein